MANNEVEFKTQSLGTKFEHSNQEATTEQLDALTGCDQHLQYASLVIEKADIPDSVRQELLQQIGRLQHRRSDPNLYLALIGEFSSGKSTLINAFLRDDLLKTSALVATAAATKIRLGKDLKVEVSFKGNRPGILKTKPNAKQITIPWYPAVNSVDTRKFIHIVTAEEQVAKDVEYITIEHPASFLANGIVIIDTPGTNATESRHGAITREIIDQESDAVLIIIPATTPLSQSLVDFLSQSLRPFLHRCIFVVTKMDRIRQQEQTTLIEHIKQRLETTLKISNPTVLPAAPQIIIDEITEEEITSKLLPWKDKFLELELTLEQRLRQQRILSIAENVIRLLNQLLTQLQGHLRTSWAEYQERQEAIVRETIPDLDAFASEQKNIMYKMIEEATSRSSWQCDNCIDKHREATLEEVRSAIFQAKDQSALAQVVETQAETILKNNQPSLEKELGQQIEKLEEAAREAGRYFDEKFAEAYRKLQTLRGGVEAATRLDTEALQENTSQIFSSMQSINTEMTKQDEDKAKNGAIIGFVIGNIIFPGFGGMIFGALAGLFSSGFFMSSLNERKQKLWDQVSPSLNDYFNRVKEQTQPALNKEAKTVTTALDERLQAYSTQYKSIVDEIMREQKLELKRLNELQVTTQTYLSEIQRRQQGLLIQQERLTKVNYE